VFNTVLIEVESGSEMPEPATAPGGHQVERQRGSAAADHSAALKFHTAMAREGLAQLRGQEGTICQCASVFAGVLKFPCVDRADRTHPVLAKLAS
jgi:hypothetical protein